MREVKGHAMPGQNILDNKIKVEVYDEPVKGVHHKYQTYYKANGQWEKGQLIQFHKMPEPTQGIPGHSTPEVAPNGVTCISLLSMVKDFLQCCNSGELPCRENSLAITKIEEAMLWLKARQADRIERGVQGTFQK